jgi:hypothetical protein
MDPVQRPAGARPYLRPGTDPARGSSGQVPGVSAQLAAALLRRFLDRHAVPWRLVPDQVRDEPLDPLGVPQRRQLGELRHDRRVEPQRGLRIAYPSTRASSRWSVTAPSPMSHGVPRHDWTACSRRSRSGPSVVSLTVPGMVMVRCVSRHRARSSCRTARLARARRRGVLGDRGGAGAERSGRRICVALRRSGRGTHVRGSM